MKKLLLIVLLLGCLTSAFAQRKYFLSATQGALAARPTTCIAGFELFAQTDVTPNQLHLCNATGTGWVVLGDVVGPSTATDNEVLVFDGTTGKVIKAGSGCTIVSGGFSCTPGTDGGAELPNNTTQTVSGATKARLIANANLFKVSENGGAYVRVVPANRATLDKITESGGSPLWNGSAWPGGGGGTWGSITGTLSSQTDLQSALDAKVASTSGSRPTCDSSHRSWTWIVQGGALVADVFYICLKDASDVYSWVAK